MRVNIEFKDGSHTQIDAVGFTEVAIYLASKNYYLWDIKSIMPEVK